MIILQFKFNYLFCHHDARKLRTSTHGQILINMSLALMGLYIFFLISGHVTSITILCGVSSALLQYFILVFFGWTLVEVVWLYLKLVKVFGVNALTTRFILKAGIPTWGKLLVFRHRVRHIITIMQFLQLYLC